jgi:glutamate/aspartate transport system substrate-binding protein
MRALLTIILIGGLYTTPLSAEELQGTLKNIQASGKIKIGYRQAHPPMSFLDKSGIPSGYSIDLCKQIVTGVEKKVGREISVDYIPVTAEDRFEALISNKIDILCGATTTTLARRELVDFTQLTFVTGGSYMVMKGRKLKNNFDGKKIGVVKDTTTAVALKKLFEEAGTKIEMVMLDTLAEGFSALQEGKLDLLSADQVVLLGLILNVENPGDFAILPDMFSYDPLALAVRRNDADFRLIADRTLSNLYRSKKIDAIYDTWFGGFGQRLQAYDMMLQLNTIPE